MAEELRFHMERYADELVEAGLPRPEAERRARLEFGGMNSIQEECRRARGLSPFDELRRQTRYAARSLRKTPRFTITVLLTLAICLGANLTIFGVVDSILIRPLPFPEPDRLVTMFNTYPKAGVDRDGSSIANYYERRGAIPAFAGVALYRDTMEVVGEAGSAEREPMARISPDFFSTLGVGPAIGRGFTDDETSFETDRVAILTDGYWRLHFNRDPSAIGAQLRVNGVPRTIVGILPPGFRFLSSEARLYLPLASSSEDRNSVQRHSGGNSKHMIARLWPGATLTQAQAQIDAQNRALEAHDPQATMIAEAGFRTLVTPLHADHVASVRPMLLWLQAGALALLMIAVVNLTNLLLIRANSRAKESAVRIALGASRWDVLRETAVETTLLALAGSLLGLALAAGGMRLLTVLGTDRLPLGTHIAFDIRLGVVAVLAAVAVGAALALPIAWRQLRTDPRTAMQAEGRGGTANRAAQNVRHASVVAQFALASILLVAAGLLGSSLDRAMAISPGFRADDVLTAQITVPWSKYGTSSARVALHAKLLQKAAVEPGVVAAGIVSNVPLSGNNGKSAVVVKGRVPLPGESPRGHYAYGVDGNYFTAMGYALRQGRFLTEADSLRASRVCVVDEDFARYYWPGADAIGQRLYEGSEETPGVEPFVVVGVVSAVKQAGLTDRTAQGAIYYPYALHPSDSVFVVLRTGAKPDSMAAALTRLVRQVDPDLPASDIRSMNARISDSLVAQRSPALIAAFFSAAALLLVTVGTYGVFGCALAERRREIGIRLALGARPRQIRGQFLSVAFRLLLAGESIGIIGAWFTSRAMRTLLFETPDLPVATLASAACVISAIALCVCLLVSQRAIQIPPAEALSEQ